VNEPTLLQDSERPAYQLSRALSLSTDSVHRINKILNRCLIVFCQATWHKEMTASEWSKEGRLAWSSDTAAPDPCQGPPSAHSRIGRKGK